MSTASVNENTREDKKKLILVSAIKAYMVYGINKATTRQIAEIAGIGKSTIYEYFKSKEALIDESLKFLIFQLSEGRKNLAKEDPVSALTIYIDTTINTSLKQPEVILLISQYTLEILMKSANFKDGNTEYQKKMYPMVQGLMNDFKFLLTKGIEMGVFKPVIETDIEGLAYTIGALIREIQAQTFILDNDELEKTCKKIKLIIFNLLGIKQLI